jgi:hypothetical protein
VASQDLVGFRAQVLDDQQLQAELLALDPAEFAGGTSAIAAREGWAVSAAEIDDAIGEARRAWLRRWV